MVVGCCCCCWCLIYLCCCFFGFGCATLCIANTFTFWWAINFHILALILNYKYMLHTDLGVHICAYVHVYVLYGSLSLSLFILLVCEQYFMCEYAIIPAAVVTVKHCSVGKMLTKTCVIHLNHELYISFRWIECMDNALVWIYTRESSAVFKW